MNRLQVSSWHGPTSETPRQALIREAMRPTESTEQWRELQALSAEATNGLTRIDCSDLIEEAGVIALHMRQVLEIPKRTSALITTDRGLARRVAAELQRWNILIDDSAGQPLAATPPGTFLRLTAEMFANDLDPIDLLAALKHPLALGQWGPGVLRAAARDLDRIALRGPRPAAGFQGLSAALVAAHETSDRAQNLLRELSEHGDEVLSLCRTDQVALAEVLTGHIRFVEWLATDEDGQCQLWVGDAGEAAMEFVSNLLQAAVGLPKIAGDGYAPLLNSLMKGQAVRPSYGLHPRLHIWGPLEARMQSADQVYLGGLNEGSWPAAAEADAWLSRPMASKLGLPAPERRIGLAAHDFVQAASSGEVILTRADKVDGTQTVPSRWLLRLDQVLQAVGQKLDCEMPGIWRDWLSQLDAAGPPQPIQAPECKPPVAARPRRLSVTQVETWIRDPYAIYARHILNLRPLDPIAADPGLADYGNAVHKALERFTQQFPNEIPDDAETILLDLGRTAFGEML
ncbi:MAG: double-strand break repair protein AddB, partial [Alphaproteobacteria bacterium]|nr:double-strand break repair protein AddB [Alphaproteobacteria bacterium]